MIIYPSKSDLPLTAIQFLSNSNTTFLRGMWPTDAHGVISFSSIFPGFYVDRSIHIHVQVHTNWNITRNGTVGSSRVVETGQIFFAEELEQEIMALEPYVSHTEIDRLTNDGDTIFAEVIECESADSLIERTTD